MRGYIRKRERWGEREVDTREKETQRRGPGEFVDTSKYREGLEEEWGGRCREKERESGWGNARPALSVECGHREAPEDRRGAQEGH